MNRNILALGVHARQLIIAGNAYADIMEVLFIDMFGHGVQETSYSENVYLSPATNYLVEYQTVHGSADDLTGKGAVNPTATLKAAAAVLEHHRLCRGIEPAMNRAIEAMTQRKILHPRPERDRYHRRAPPPGQPTTFSLSASASQPRPPSPPPSPPSPTTSPASATPGPKRPRHPPPCPTRPPRCPRTSQIIHVPLPQRPAPPWAHPLGPPHRNTPAAADERVLTETPRSETRLDDCGIRHLVLAGFATGTCRFGVPDRGGASGSAS